MKNIMGLILWIKKYSRVINRIILLSLFVFDTYLVALIYRPTELKQLTQNLEGRVEQIIKLETSPSPTPTQQSPKPSAVPQASTNPTATPSTTTSPAPSTTAAASSTPTPTPTATPTPTPTPTTTPNPTPTPTPTPTPATSSSVYITGYVYANNQQLIAEQYPVKVVNTQTNEVIASGETNHEGKSPTWNIPAGTSIRVTLYPKPGFNGCGEEWNLTIGTLGTLETHNLSIQGNRSPCIQL